MNKIKTELTIPDVTKLSEQMEVLYIAGRNTYGRATVKDNLLVSFKVKHAFTL